MLACRSVLTLPNRAELGLFMEVGPIYGIITVALKFDEWLVFIGALTATRVSYCIIFIIRRYVVIVSSCNLEVYSPNRYY